MKAWTSGHTLRSFEFGALEFECCFHMEKTLKLGFVLRGVGLAFEAMRLRSLALVSGACGFVGIFRHRFLLKARSSQPDRLSVFGAPESEAALVTRARGCAARRSAAFAAKERDDGGGFQAFKNVRGWNGLVSVKFDVLG